jgi:tetratricopeptide (TPR) repeat protein
VRNERLKTTLAVFMALTIGSMCAATYMRNSAWATEFSLWQDAMYKAPASARPLTNIAWQLAYGPNARPSQFDTAIKLYQRALLLQKPRSFSESVILNNIAGIYFRRGENQKAIDLLEKALAISPDYNRGRSDLTNILIASGRWDAAVVHADYLLAKNDTHEGYLNLKGLILLHQKKYDEAIAAFRRAFSIAPFFKRTLLNLGVAYSLQGDYRSADIYFARAIKLPPKNIIPFLGLIGTRLKAGDFKGAQKYAGILLDSFDTAVVKDQLKNFANDHLTSFISADSISSVIEGQWADNSEDPRKNAN